MRVLSICCGMGLFDRAFLDAGYEVVAGCEIDPEQEALYRQVCGDRPAFHTLEGLVDGYRRMGCEPGHFDGIIGGPPCQSHTRLKAMRAPKFPDLTPLVQELLELVQPRWFLFENVVPLDLVGAKRVRLNAMHFAQPHQSRERWFTHSPNIYPPEPLYRGTVDDLMAYSIVAGRIYGKRRAAVLQGWPRAAELEGTPLQIVKGLANAVHYEVARAWAVSIKTTKITNRHLGRAA